MGRATAATWLGLGRPATAFTGAAATFALALGALVLGPAILGIRGHYFAIATLGLSIVAADLASAWEYVGAASGMTVPVFPGEIADRSRFFYYLLFALAAITFLAARALYAGAPSSPLPGPGAALPSAQVFAAEPIYNSIPGLPAMQPPLTPNNNPGLPPMPLPASGAAQPSAPVFALEPLVAHGTPASQGIGQPQGGKGSQGAPVVPSVPTPPIGSLSTAATPAAAPGIPPHCHHRRRPAPRQAQARQPRGTAQGQAR